VDFHEGVVHGHEQAAMLENPPSDLEAGVNDMPRRKVFVPEAFSTHDDEILLGRV
jgi:hypothetical protein